MHSRPHRSPVRHVACVVAAALALGACSSGPDRPPIEGVTEIDGDSTFDFGDSVEVVGLSASPAGTWGFGRAIEAHPLPDGGLAVVTTVGVVTVSADGPASAPRQVARFGASNRPDSSVVSADGQTVIVVTQSPAAVEWHDLATASIVGRTELPVGTVVRTLDARPASGGVVAVTADGMLAIPSAGAEVDTLVDSPVGTVAELTGGRMVVPILDSTELAVIDGGVADRREVDVPDGAGLDDAKASPDGSVLAVSHSVGANDIEKISSILLLDPEDLTEIATIDLGRPLLASEWAVSSSGVVVADGTALSAWNADGQPVASVESAGDTPITSVYALQQGVVAIHRAGAIASWAPGASDPVPLSAGGTTIRSASADAGRLTTVDFFGAIRTYDVGTGADVSEVRFAQGEATDVAHRADGSALAVATTAGRAFVLDPTLATTYTIEVGDSVRVDAVGFQPGTGQLVTGLAERVGELAFDDTVTLWNADGTAPEFEIGGEAEDVAGCAFFDNAIGFSPDGSLMSTLSHDFSVTLIDASSGEVVSVLPPAPSTILDAAFSPDGDVFVTSSDDSTVTVWEVGDPENPAMVASYLSVAGGYQSLELLPGGSMIASDLTGLISVVDAVSGDVVGTVADTGARSPVIAVSVDGGVVASALQGGSVGIWSTSTGESLATLDGHTDDVVAISFGPDGGSIVTASKDGTARAWTLETTES